MVDKPRSSLLHACLLRITKPCIGTSSVQIEWLWWTSRSFRWWWCWETPGLNTLRLMYSFCIYCVVVLLVTDLGSAWGCTSNRSVSNGPMCRLMTSIGSTCKHKKASGSIGTSITINIVWVIVIEYDFPQPESGDWGQKVFYWCTIFRSFWVHPSHPDRVATT